MVFASFFISVLPLALSREFPQKSPLLLFPPSDFETYLSIGGQRALTWL